MKAEIIEKFDRQRYWAVILETVGLFVIILSTLMSYIRMGVDPEMFTIGGGMLCLPGLILLFVGGVWYGILWLKIRRDKEIHNALYNEMYMQHKFRYQRATLWLMIIMSLASFFCIPRHYPHLPVTEMIVFFSLLIMKILWLIYNRR